MNIENEGAHHTETEMRKKRAVEASIRQNIKH